MKTNQKLLRAYIDANEKLRRRRAVVSAWPPHGESVFHEHIAEFTAAETEAFQAARRALDLGK